MKTSTTLPFETTPPALDARQRQYFVRSVQIAAEERSTHDISLDTVNALWTGCTIAARRAFFAHFDPCAAYQGLR